MVQCWYFGPSKDHQSVARQYDIIFFFDSKPKQKASFDYFRKSQEFSVQVIS